MPITFIIIHLLDQFYNKKNTVFKIKSNFNYFITTYIHLSRIHFKCIFIPITQNIIYIVTLIQIKFILLKLT